MRHQTSFQEGDDLLGTTRKILVLYCSGEWTRVNPEWSESVQTWEI